MQQRQNIWIFVSCIICKCITSLHLFPEQRCREQEERQVQQGISVLFVFIWTERLQERTVRQIVDQDGKSTRGRYMRRSISWSLRRSGKFFCQKVCNSDKMMGIKSNQNLASNFYLNLTLHRYPTYPQLVLNKSFHNSSISTLVNTWFFNFNTAILFEGL